MQRFGSALNLNVHLHALMMDGVYATHPKLGRGLHFVRVPAPSTEKVGTSSIRVGLLEIMERLAAIIPQPRTHQFLYHGVFASNAKYRKEILPKYRRVRAKPKWKKLSRKDGIKSRHVAWAQLFWRSFGVMGFVCQHCGCLMRLRAVAIYPPATTKILRGLSVNLHGLGFTGPP